MAWGRRRRRWSPPEEPIPVKREPRQLTGIQAFTSDTLHMNKINEIYSKLGKKQQAASQRIGINLPVRSKTKADVVYFSGMVSVPETSRCQLWRFDPWLQGKHEFVLCLITKGKEIVLKPYHPSWYEAYFQPDLLRTSNCNGNFGIPLAITEQLAYSTKFSTSSAYARGAREFIVPGGTGTATFMMDIYYAELPEAAIWDRVSKGRVQQRLVTFLRRRDANFTDAYGLNSCTRAETVLSAVYEERSFEDWQNDSYSHKYRWSHHKSLTAALYQGHMVKRIDMHGSPLVTIPGWEEKSKLFKNNLYQVTPKEKKQILITP